MTCLKPLLAATLATFCLAPTAIAAEVRIGELTCEQTDRTNLLLFSEAKFACSFKATDGAREYYRGEVSKVGVDLTTSRVETMVWYVFAAANTVRQDALAGTYVGASGDASVGVGAGVRVLVGGFEDSFTLQPASVSGQEGFGVSAGVERFVLTPR